MKTKLKLKLKLTLYATIVAVVNTAIFMWVSGTRWQWFEKPTITSAVPAICYFFITVFILAWQQYKPRKLFTNVKDKLPEVGKFYIVLNKSNSSELWFVMIEAIRITEHSFITVTDDFGRRYITTHYMEIDASDMPKKLK